MGCRLGQAEPKQLNEIHGGARGMLAAAQKTQTVRPLDGERQAGEQPRDQQAVRVMKADMFEVVTVFGVIKTLILDLPSALGSALHCFTHFSCGCRAVEHIEV